MLNYTDNLQKISLNPKKLKKSHSKSAYKVIITILQVIAHSMKN